MQLMNCSQSTSTVLQLLECIRTAVVLYLLSPYCQAQHSRLAGYRNPDHLRSIITQGVVTSSNRLSRTVRTPRSQSCSIEPQHEHNDGTQKEEFTSQHRCAPAEPKSIDHVRSEKWKESCCQTPQCQVGRDCRRRILRICVDGVY